MKMTFEGKKISAILGVLPENEVYFEDEVGNYSFPEKQTLRLKKVMGYEKHRISKETSTVSDFAIAGIRHMLDNKWIDKDEIGAVIVVTLCPDYFVPHISNIIHAEFDLCSDVICLDISQGCCGFVLGLWQSFMVLEHIKDKKVILVNGDILSHKVSKKDRNDYPLIGDGAAISVIENTDDNNKIFYEMHVDGKKGDALKIPAGGFRMPSSPETAVMEETDDGNYRALDHMHMDGSAVFNFVQLMVPPLIESILKDSGNSVEDIDYFLFHQPNKFMLQKLAQKVGIPFEKLPMNLVEQCGNPSGSSIPLVTVLNCKEEMEKGKYKCCLSGFGSGLAWGAIVMDIGNMEHCDYIISDL